MSMIAFGPVPSRRLGKSLGINNILPKRCSYSCVYCQVGKTVRLTHKREEFYKPEDIFGDVQELIVKLKRRGEKIDYITFIPDGEPTLDINLGSAIDLIKLLNYKVAVITNGSMITDCDIKNDLRKADYVSLKIDTTNKKIWQKINRPHQSLQLESILEHMREFAATYDGILTTETMLVDGINTSSVNIENVSIFLDQLKPRRAYIAVPIRPAAEKSVRIPHEAIINMAFHIFKEKLNRVEYLLDYEGADVGYSGEVEKDLLNIAAVHPLKFESVLTMLGKANAGWDIIEHLLSQEKLKEVEYAGAKFYIRNFQNDIDKGGRK